MPEASPDAKVQPALLAKQNYSQSSQRSHGGSFIKKIGMASFAHLATFTRLAANDRASHQIVVEHALLNMQS
jgi:hypothetical protein